MKNSIRQPLAALLLVAPVAAQSWTNSHPSQPGWTIDYAASVAKQAGDNQIFLFGGSTGSSSLDDVWRYHRTTGWAVLSDMPGGRHLASAATVNVGGQDYVHLFGGGVGATSATALHWRYDPATDSWDTATPAPMPLARTRFEAVTAPNGLIYVFGGSNSSGGTTYSTVHVYDPVANTWSAAPSMPRPRRDFAAIADCDGYIYLYGGSAGATTHAEVDCFDTVSNVWVSTSPHSPPNAFPDMPTPRSSLAGALGRDGRHYLTGGNVASPVAVPTVEVFDPYTNTWSTAASMIESRNAHRVVGLGNRIWVLGGYRKIWPTTKSLESFGPLGYKPACADDVAPLPPIIFGTAFASAVELAPHDTFVGGHVDPISSNFFWCHAAPGLKTEIQVDSLDPQAHLLLRVYDGGGNLLTERPARQGIVLDGSLVPTQRFFLEILDGGGIGSSAYDLYVNSNNAPRPVGQVYATPAVPNSTGDPAGIRALGLASAAANELTLQAASLPPTASATSSSRRSAATSCTRVAPPASSASVAGTSAATPATC